MSESETNHPFSIFQTLPWFTDLVLSSQRITSLLQHPTVTANRFHGLIATLVKRLSDFEDGVLLDTASSNKNIQLYAPLLLSKRRSLDPHERNAFFCSLNSERQARFISYLLDYRMVDILLALEGGFGSFGEVDRTSYPMPQKMNFRMMSNWPDLVARSLSILAEYDLLADKSELETPQTSLQIFSSMARRNDQLDAHKILANFECAAAYLSLMHQGITELPTALPEFKSFLIQTFPECDKIIGTDCWDRLFETIKTIHSFKLPLQLSVSFSPLCLFLPSLLMSKDLNRAYLFWFWQGLGGTRCNSLVAVEKACWVALNEISSGTFSTWARLRMLFRQLKAIDLTDVSYTDATFFGGDPLFLEVVPRGSAATSGGALPVENKVALNRSTKKPRSRSNTPIKLDIQAPGGSSELVDRRITRSVTAALKKVKQPILLPVSSPRKKPRRKTVSKSVSFHVPLAEGGVPALDIDVPDTLPPAPKRRKGSNGKAIRVVDVIDLSAETTVKPINLQLVELTIDAQSAGMEVVVWALNNKYHFIPAFRYQKDMEWFQSIMAGVTASLVNGLPLHIRDRNLSLLEVLQSTSLTAYSVSQLQSLFRSRCLIVLDLHKADYNFDEVGFRTLTMHNLDKVVPVLDFSISPEDTRLVHGSLNQLIRRSGPKSFQPLQASGFPMPNGVDPPRPLLSDVVAWDYMVGLPWCSPRSEMPRSVLKLGSAWTSDSFSPLQLTPNGLATYIEVKTGTVVVFVARPRTTSVDGFVSLGIVSKLLSKPPVVDHAAELVVEAFPLHSGTSFIWRPNIACAFLTAENAILHNSHFLSTSTLRHSCYGLFHSFTGEQPVDPHLHNASWAILRRMVHYFHLVLTEGRYLELQKARSEDDFNAPEVVHTPDVTAPEGVIDILTLCNVMELAGILSLRRHTSNYEREHFIEARRLCRRMVVWLESVLTVTDHHGVVNIWDDLWMPYLVQHTKAIQDCKSAISKASKSPPSISADVLSEAISLCFEGNDGFHRAYSKTSFLVPDSYAWPGDRHFEVSLRDCPIVPEYGSIDGTTGEDRAYFSKYLSHRSEFQPGEEPMTVL